MSESGIYLSSGFLKFNSIDDLRRNAKQLLDYYQKEVDKFSEILGASMRVQESAEKGKKKPEKGKVAPKRWQKIGPILISTSDTNLATIEIMLGLLEEMKLKLGKTTEAMKSFEEIAEINIPRDSTFNLYFRNGVPERIIVESKTASPPV